MIGQIQLKVCGLTTPADAAVAAESGADYLGFVLHEKSPRRITLARFGEMLAELPDRPKVAVLVEPGPGTLASLRQAGFDRLQVHFRHETPQATLESWSLEAGGGRLWLAPKLPPAADVPPAWLSFCSHVLLDTFDPVLFGGTGRAGDWAKFRRHASAHPAHGWILSGGLNPGNIGTAIRESGARFVDVNSGVESAPGVKDHGKVRAFAEALASA
ncbi:MAG TPA: phosphoribosylanthranilate isomerase [Opitutaceae bacterium]|jgi:phosphoribosylanthranilate isomerase